MSLTSAVHESLPYIDSEPTAAERAAAQALIAAELDSPEPTHPNLPELPPSHFTPVIEAEILRLSNKKPLIAIDTSSYESLADPDDDASIEEWRNALSRAYTAERYLTGRLTNLKLLEEYGKNGWLVGNSQLEAILAGVEKELRERKEEIDTVVVERRRAQEAVGGELSALEEGWEKGVGRVLETEVAAEGLRQAILERRREAVR